MENEKVYKVAILQRVIPAYRKALFEEISKLPYVNLIILYGDDIPDSKVRSGLNKKNDLNIIKHRSTFLQISKRIFVWHHGLFRSLKRFKPDLIISEGESNILSYLQAFFYKKIFKNTKIIHWSVGGLPASKTKPLIIRFIKTLLLKIFDSYIVYSSYGKKELINNFGVDSKKIFVAVNISQVDKFLDLHLRFNSDKKVKNNDIRNFNHNKFTLVTCGSLVKEKNFQLILEAYENIDENNFNLILIGDGNYKNELKKIVYSKKLRNVFFVGHVNMSRMAKFFFLSDLFILPGRGGMVISESMACGLPVLLRAADGVEFDLVKENFTGFYYKNNNSHSLAKRILEISSNQKLLKNVSKNSYLFIKENYSIKNYALSIGNAIKSSLKE